MKRVRWSVIPCLILAAGCGSAGPGIPSSPVLTDADAHELGVEVPPLVYQMLAVFQQVGPAAPIFVRGLEGAPPQRADTLAGPASCPARLSGAVDDDGRPIDSDGDGIPDSISMTYAPGTCRLPWGGGEVVEFFTGTVQIRDLPGPYAFTWEGDFTDSLDRGGGAFTSRRTRGTEAAALAADEMTLDADYTVAVRFAHDGLNGTGTYHETWSARFIPDSGSSLAPGVRTPSGTITLAGTFVAAEPAHGRAGQFRLFTSLPIHYSAPCDAQLLYPAFTAGQVTGVLTSDTTAGFTVNFNGCYTAPVIVGHGTGG
jgi:hypothetical protein